MLEKEVSAENLFSEETYKQFVNFCDEVNRSPYIPSHKKVSLWYKFIITSFRNNDLIFYGNLEKLLSKLNLSEDDIIELMVEYEYGISLLQDI